jgi:hypothetical protein
MSHLENEEENDILTEEEKNKISCLVVKKEELNVNINNFNAVLTGVVTNHEIPFNLGRITGYNKTVRVNNISSKNVWLVITPHPIKTIETVGVSFHNIKFNISLKQVGEYEIQKIPILNNTPSLIHVDTTDFYCTLYFDIDGNLVKTWTNRKFNSRNYDINILERHAELAKQITPLNLK